MDFNSSDREVQYRDPWINTTTERREKDGGTAEIWTG